jgi:hypothetical protein
LALLSAAQQGWRLAWCSANEEKRARERVAGMDSTPTCRPAVVQWSAWRPNAGVDGCDQAMQLAEKAFILPILIPNHENRS